VPAAARRLGQRHLNRLIEPTALALVLDQLIRVMEIASLKRSRALSATAWVLVLAVLLGGLSPIFVSRSGQDRRQQVVLGAKTFTEQYILAGVVAEQLRSRGFSARTLESLGSTVAFDALAAGEIDAYVDYTGTIWANYMGRVDNPGRARILTEVAAWLRDEHGIELVASLGFENAYALATTRTFARERGIATIDDLAPLAPALAIGGDYEFFGRPEWRDLETQYALDFRATVTMDSTLMYAAVASGDVDVISAFSTDGRIAAYDLTLLEDTRGALPPYDAVLLASRPALERLPGLRAVLATFDGAIDAETMRAANRAVDLDGRDVGEAIAIILERLRNERAVR
jgi:osmoprotectant transport system permease protein